VRKIKKSKTYLLQEALIFGRSFIPITLLDIVAFRKVAYPGLQQG
jgi:hypothetical protein